MIPPELDATLVLLRHGETTAIVEGRFQGQSPVPLSLLGRRQAERAGLRLARPHASPALPVPLGPPREIVHSPLARTAETAVTVANAAAAQDGFGRDIELVPEPGLMEIAQGDWEGRLATEIESRWGDLLLEWRQRPSQAHAPGGEQLAEVQARVRPALTAILDRLNAAPRGTLGSSSPVLGAAHGSDNPWSILVAHDGVFKVALLTLFNLPLVRFWLFPFALCGISVVELTGGQPRLRAHNLTDHLAPLLEEEAQAATEERERTGAL
jgi:probable phosphoglycerate mutase